MKLPLCLLFAAVLTSPLARASDPPSTAEETAAAKEKPKVSESIVVTATRSEREVSEVPVSTTVITEKEIENSPVLVPDDLLRTVPGVQLPFSTSVNTFFGANTASIRGSGGSRALVLLDGIPMHEPYYGTVLWQKAPMSTVRRIEVVRGSNASLFGNFAVGGTIHLMTRPIDESSVRAEFSYGTASTHRESATVDQRLGDRWGLRLAYNGFNTDGVLRIVTPGLVDVPAWNDTSMGLAHADFTLSEKTHGFLKASYIQTDLSAGTALSNTALESFDYAGSVQHAVGRGHLLSATVFHRDETLGITNTTVAPGRVSEFVSSVSDIPVDDTGASLEWFGSGGGTFSFVSAGLDVRETEANEQRQTLNRNGVVTLADAVNGTQRFAGVFGQASWRPNARVEVLASARIDHFSNRGENVVQNGATTTYPSTDTTQFDPRLAARFVISPQASLRGAIYRAFRAPTLRDLYRNAQTPTSNAIANPFLQPETMIGGDLGFEWTIPRFRAELNLYRNEIDDLLTRVRLAGTENRSQTQNVGTARSQGVELFGTFDLTKQLLLRAGYTYADAQILENPGDPTLVGKQIENVVPHLGTIELQYRRPTGGWIGARFRMLSDTWGEAVNLAKVPAHQVLDLNASWPVGHGVELYVIGENVLNEKYNYVINATNFRPAETRTVSGGFRFYMPTARRGGV